MTGSTQKRRFYIVDVFTDQKYAGNQLAVIRDSAGLSSEEMLLIAQEMNYSETTFIMAEAAQASDAENLAPEAFQNGGFPVRIFTPGEEVPFAGHPTLGTAAVIRDFLLQQPVDELTLNLTVGPILVEWQNDILWMRQNTPDFDKKFDPEALADVLGLTKDEIDATYPVQDVSTGLPFIICPLVSQEALNSIYVDRQKMLSLVANSRAKAVLVFAPQPDEKEMDLSVRVFTDYYGIPEDPATGSANGCLAGYLARYTYFGESTVDIRVAQGVVMGRPSTLYLFADDDGEQIDVRVGGKVVMVAEGTLL